MYFASVKMYTFTLSYFRVEGERKSLGNGFGKTPMIEIGRFVKKLPHRWWELYFAFLGKQNTNMWTWTFVCFLTKNRMSFP